MLLENKNTLYYNCKVFVFWTIKELENNVTGK